MNFQALISCGKLCFNHFSFSICLTNGDLNNSSSAFTFNFRKRIFSSKIWKFLSDIREYFRQTDAPRRKVAVWFAFYINFGVIYFSLVWIGWQVRVNRVKEKMTFFTCFKSDLRERVCILLEIWILRPSDFHICLNIYQALNMLGIILSWEHSCL